MRIGIYGGSFDPVHNGHVNLVKQMIERLSLQKVFIVVANISPHKQEKPPHATGDQRLAMAKLAFEAIEEAVISAIEVDRGGISYTIDTVETVKEAFENDEIFLLVGKEALKDFDSWERAADIKELVEVAYVVDEREDFQAGSKKTFPISWDNTCSTEIRERLSKGEECKEYLSPKVVDYIAKHQLYSRAYDNG